MLPTFQRLALTLAASLLLAASATAPARAVEPAQDEAVAYAAGVQTYVYGFPMMDLYRTLWETGRRQLSRPAGVNYVGR